MPDNSDKPTTAHNDPSEKGWAVLVSKAKVWREAAQGSAILFVFAVGVAAIVWTAWTGGEFVSPIAVFQSREAARDRLVSEVEPALTIDEPAFRRALDGKPLDAEHAGNYAAVIIDNMTPARPSSGLSAAVLVIEAPVESAITRLLAFFDLSDEVERIGPVRSVRPYYLDWAAESDAMIVHVGGSPAALDLLKSGTLRDLNEFSNGASFWRDQNRYAPHNTYTSTERMRASAERRYAGHEIRTAAPWLFRDDTAASSAEVVDDAVETGRAVLSVGYNATGYDVRWIHDPATNEYVREQGGKLQKDGGVQLRAKNVAVQFTTVRVLDEVGRRSVRTTGTGKAIIATDGQFIEGMWETVDGRTRFLGPDGDEVVFLTGTTWIQVVPDGYEVTFGNEE